MALQPHYTFLEHIFPASAGEFAVNLQKLSFALAVAVALLLIGRMCSSKLRTPQEVKDAVVPSKRPSLFGFCDLLMEMFIKYQDSVIGKEHRKHIPFTASVFFFIFILNFLSLIPGLPSSTTTVWVNVGIALAVFIYFNVLGVKTHGVMGYIKHFMGPSIWLAILIFPLEIMSTLMRILTLNLRLYWNITADHLVLDTFVSLLKPTYILAAPFYFLGVFVSVIQALVFATLTMVYILLATQHEEHH